MTVITTSVTINSRLEGSDWVAFGVRRTNDSAAIDHVWTYLRDAQQKKFVDIWGYLIFGTWITETQLEEDLKKERIKSRVLVIPSRDYQMIKVFRPNKGLPSIVIQKHFLA